MKNNTYLYNLLLDHEFCNYTEDMDCVLGIEPSFAMYLFSYSRDLFFSYPKHFLSNSLIVYSDHFFNVCLHLASNISHISHLSYNYKNINFRYIDQYKHRILNIRYANDYNKIFQYNEPNHIVYNGLKFTLAKVEDVISYCLFSYGKHFHTDDLRDASVLACIYQKQIISNNILINLLKLGCNIKKTFQKALKCFDNIFFFNMPLDFPDYMIRDRVRPLLHFCYDN